MKNLLSLLLVLFLVAPPAAWPAQLVPDFIPPPKAYTVGTLPTSGVNNGQLARVTDGDAAGAYIVWDATDSAWYTIEEKNIQVINPGAPPYNCDRTVEGGANNTCLRALATRLTSVILAGGRPTVRWASIYTVTHATTFDYGANSTALVDWVGTGAIGGGLTCKFEGAACVIFQTSLSTLNGFTFKNFVISGGSIAPDSLLYFPQGAAQVTWTGGGFSNFNYAGWNGKCQNCQFVGLTLAMHNFNPDSAGSGEAWFFDFFQLRNVEIDNVSVEVTNFDTVVGIVKARSQPSGLSIANVNCVGDGVRLRRFLEVNGAAGLDPKNITVMGNTCQQLREYAISADATSGQRVLGLRIIGNNFSRSIGAGGTAALALNRVRGAIIANNQLSDFGTCMDLDVFKESLVLDNVLDGCGTGIHLDNIYFGNKIEGNSLRNITTTGIDLATSSTGPNVVRNNDFTGTIPPNPYLTPGLMNAEYVQMGKMPINMVCADTGDATVSMQTTAPYQWEAVINNVDASGGCRWNVPSGYYRGQTLRTRHGSTVSAQATKVSVDNGVNCVTVDTTNKFADWRWNGSSWVQETSLSSVGC